MGAGIERELASSADKSMEMVRSCGKIGRVPYGQKGVDGKYAGNQG